MLRTKKVIIENIDNWGPHENDFLCNIFVSGLPMICLFATFVPFFSFFTLCSCVWLNLHCGETTHCMLQGCTQSLAATHSVGTVTGIWDLKIYTYVVCTLEEMRSLKNFLNHCSIHAPLSHMRLCLSLSILPFKAMKFGDHFNMHLGY